MELYLHIGTNKTASSYLQTLLIINASNLTQAGIYIPSSRWDVEMEKGIITPGNGHDLVKILSMENEKKLVIYLQKIYEEAKQKKLNKILLSNEVIVRLFSNESVLNNFETYARKVGFLKIRCLCFLRNPYGHALSLFKHRLKSGRSISYSEWLQTDYETLNLFQIFLQHYQKYTIDWDFRVYKKDSDFLSEIFFKDFLNYSDVIILPSKKTVNKSINLKLIQQIQFLHKEKSGIKKYLLNDFANQSSKETESVFLLNQFYSECQKYFKKHISTINNLAQLLPNDERKFLLEPPIIQAPLEDDSQMLTEENLKSIDRAIRKYDNNYFIDALKRFYIKLKRKMNINKKFDRDKYGGNIRH